MPDLPFNLQDRLGEARETFRGRFTSAFNGVTVWSVVRTLLWLGPLTILIWFTAETSRNESSSFDVTVDVASNDMSRVAHLQDPADGRVRVNVIGPRTMIQRLETQLGGQVTLNLSDTNTTGLVARSARDLLRDTPTFRDFRRVRIENTVPADLRINVEPVVEQTVPVRIPALVTNVSAIFNPANVTIRGPQSVIETARRTGSLIAEADIAGSPMLQTPGKKDPITITVRSNLRGTSVTPSTVTATLDVRATDVPFTIPSMPVWAALPPGVTDRVRLTLEPNTIFNVAVVGTPEAIEKLKAGTAVARLDFAPEDVNAIQNGQSGSIRPTIVLPPGVKLDPSVENNTMVNWSAERRGGD
jgi:hypothetical protein